MLCGNGPRFPLPARLLWQKLTRRSSALAFHNRLHIPLRGGTPARPIHCVQTIGPRLRLLVAGYRRAPVCILARWRAETCNGGLNRDRSAHVQLNFAKALRHPRSSARLPFFRGHSYQLTSSLVSTDSCRGSCSSGSWRSAHRPPCAQYHIRSMNLS